jgi:hypothetical protein
MSASVLLSFIGIALLVVINIAAVAFSYGKLNQKVNDLCRRVDRIDRIINHTGIKEKSQCDTP